MALYPEIVEKHFEKIEKIAEETLSDQQEIRCLDKRCNKNREALRQLQTNPNCLSSKSWVCVGNLFIRLPTHEVKKNIEQDMLDVSLIEYSDKLKS
ncbi:p53 and DNA damage-regulated protein 1 [Armadillidium nasatum]|uniref:p53 and DNA damage-regulated protein 1 n=1 Tax=Armadillidium nasatum TaxID=96803 RepID=A0A5N5TJF3_9CRUS|nr:p53 and DNA damage-regulated protein 1 [Armadillidium nasatum]